MDDGPDPARPAGGHDTGDRPDAARLAVALGRALRAAGVPTTPDRAATFVAAAALTGAAGIDDLYWPARLAFVSSRDHLPAFERVFAALAGAVDPAGARGEPTAPPRTPPRVRGGAREPSAAPGDAPPSAAGGAGGRAERGAAGGRRDVRLGARASDVERVSHLRLDALDAAELAVVAELIGRLRIAAPPRRTRRSRPSRRGERLDVRATLRRARRTGGDPVRRLHRRRRRRPRPIVALLDVSGSMAPYARAHLLLLQAAARGARAEAFVFATRLTRVTRALAEGRAEAAIVRAAEGAPDWAGGTRIGDALRTFVERWGRRGMARGAVVVICSDGWERGDPALVGVQMARLSRLAYRIVWVNPRAAAPGFAPATAGMAAALPHVDELVSGHSAAGLEDIVAAIGRHR